MYFQDEVQVFESTSWKIRNAEVTGTIFQLVFWLAVTYLHFQAPPVPSVGASHCGTISPPAVLGYSALVTFAVHPLCSSGFFMCPGGSCSSDEHPP